MIKVYPILIFLISIKANAYSINLVADNSVTERTYKELKKDNSIEERFNQSLSSYSIKLPVNVRYSIFLDIAFDGSGYVNNTHRVSDSTAQAYSEDRSSRGISFNNSENILFSFNEELDEIKKYKIRSQSENETCAKKRCLIFKERLSLGLGKFNYTNSGIDQDPFNFINQSEEFRVFGEPSREIKEYDINYYIGFYWKNRLLNHSIHYGLDLPIIDINLSSTDFNKDSISSKAHHQKVVNINSGIGMSFEVRKKINRFIYGLSFRALYQKSVFSKIEANYKDLLLSELEIDDNVKLSGISEINLEYIF